MLQSLSVRNVVLIDKLDLEFKKGLSVLTGETGAGKSILLDSLGMITGNRAETSLIRMGEDKLSVTAVFDEPEEHSELQRILNDNEIDCDGELIIKRTLGQDGKGKIFINDQAVSLKLLKEVGKYLVEVHGQFDNQGLLNPVNHMGVLDSYGGYEDKLAATKQSWQEYKKAQKERREAEANIIKAKEDEENLRHWVKELEAAQTYEGEEEELSNRRAELMNAEKIIESLSYAYNVLTQNTDVQSAIRHAQSAMDKAASHVEGKYDEIIAALDRALIETSEAINQIEAASENISMNTNELENIEGRLFMLKGLARKHQVSVSELPQVLADFQQKIGQIEFGEEGLEQLRKTEQEKRLQYIENANKLSQARKAAAAKLDKCVMSELPPLKMEKANFVTEIKEVDENGWSETGINEVMFTVATNPNSPQGPINKIASGGELARFMLALKVNLANSSHIGTMIFDEVDAGVGGATAQAVGERLARLAQQVQVMVVTHSPQVASRGNNHFKVEKHTENNVTTTTVRELSASERQEEIARMLAGDIITDEARAAANVLINSKSA